MYVNENSQITDLPYDSSAILPVKELPENKIQQYNNGYNIDELIGNSFFCGNYPLSYFSLVSTSEYDETKHPSYFAYYLRNYSTFKHACDSGNISETFYTYEIYSKKICFKKYFNYYYSFENFENNCLNNIVADCENDKLITGFGFTGTKLHCRNDYEYDAYSHCIFEDPKEIFLKINYYCSSKKYDIIAKFNRRIYDYKNRGCLSTLEFKSRKSTREAMQKISFGILYDNYESYLATKYTEITYVVLR